MNRFLVTFDRIALGLFHGLVLGWLPLVAAGMFVQSIAH